VRQLQFAVTDGKSFTQLETDDTVARAVSLVDPQSLTYQQTSTDKQGRWRLTKNYVTDPARSSVLLDVKFDVLSGGPYRLFTLYDPSLAGDSGNDSGSTVDSALVSSDTHSAAAPIASALVASTGFTATSTGYVGSVSDGQQDLIAHHALTSTYPQAGPGNISQVGEIPVKPGATLVTLALGFAGSSSQALGTAQASLSRPFGATRGSYQSGWHQYLSTLKAVPAALGTGKLATQYWTSVMTVKAHEDKTFPGAFIASLTIPWGQAADASAGAGGYQFVWARDEYEQATGLLAAGDTVAAKQAVTWLFTRQQETDGHFPQNSKVDGTPVQTNVQLDETAYPIVLAWQTGQFDKTFYTQHIAKAADYLVANGPSTPQERWEETGGYSPSTIADEIAGLTAAADIAAKNGDTAGAAIYQATADYRHPLRRQVLHPDQRQRKPRRRRHPQLAQRRRRAPGEQRRRRRLPRAHPARRQGAGRHLRRAFARGGRPVDQGQHPQRGHVAPLHLRRLRRDRHGAPWTGVGIGRPWPLLSGERGEYVLANGGNALSYLQSMANSANDGYMIPEQVWDLADPTSYGHVFGKGTGSAAPLAWAMAQYARLAQGIGAGKPVETPSVVTNRYATGHEPAAPSLTVTSPTDLSTATSRTAHVTGTTSGTAVYISVNGAKQAVPLSNGNFDATVTLPSISNQIVIAAVGAGGGTAEQIRTVLAFGSRGGGVTDPTGDDNGPGSYVYPTDGAFNPGSFDLTNFDVYQDGSNIRMVTRLAGAINNPWGGNGMSTQRLNIYVHDSTNTATTSTPLLPGTNMNAAGPWSQAIVADGRHQSSAYGEGVYGPGLTKIGAADLQVLPTSHQIVVTIPASVFGSTDLAKATYQVSMFSDAEDGEGIGNVRPVYSLDCWNGGSGCPWFIKQYRFGDGAGNWDGSMPSQDTDTSDPNAIEIISGSTPQSTALDWTNGSPVTVPSTNSGPTGASGSSPRPHPASAAPTDPSGTPASGTYAAAMPSSLSSCPALAGTPETSAASSITSTSTALGCRS
jgi:GH15 family glucan-1,4-alpha-glucosidase